MNTDPFWLYKPEILIETNRLIEFFPTNNQSDIEQLNSISRFGIYISILLAMYHKNIKYLLLCLVTFGITYVIYKQKYDGTGKPKKTTTLLDDVKELGTYTLPTKQNPMMNPNVYDRKDKPKAIDYYDNTNVSQEVRKDIKDKLLDTIYRNVDDVFISAKQRDFYTVPNTKPYSDMKTFREYLYKGMPSCKTNTFDCTTGKYYENLAGNPYIFPNSLKNSNKN
jgi:hypothetical protein